MAKDDITTTTLLAWDMYEGKPADQALQAIYDHAGGTCTRMCNWYWHSIKAKRRTSVVARLLTFALLILGTVLPILAALNADPGVKLQFTQYGVVALAVGGLIQVADRVFGWSSGWLRYITTVTAMENLTRKFELEWAGYILNKTEDLCESDCKQLFDLAKQFEDDIVKLQTDETDKWATEFSSGTALLGDLIKAQRESGEKAVEAARAAVASQQAAAQATEKAKQNGAVEVTLTHKAEPKPVTIAIDDNASEEFLGTVWSKLDLPPGQHILTVATTETTPQTIKKVLDIPPGGTAHAEAKM